MASVDILRAARARIADPKNWTQGSFARDKNEDEVASWSSSAVCWCAWGAIRAECKAGSLEYALEYANAYSLARNSAVAEFGCGTIEQVNDMLGHAAVLRLFDAAIAAAEAEAR